MAKEKKEATVVDALKLMRTLFLKKGWTQIYFAVTKSGKITEANSRSAVAFCMVGAKQRACDKLGLPYPARHQIDELLQECIGGNRDVVSYNDAKGRTKKQIIAVVNCAIKKAASA